VEEYSLVVIGGETEQDVPGEHLTESLPRHISASSPFSINSIKSLA